MNQLYGEIDRLKAEVARLKTGPEDPAVDAAFWHGEAVRLREQRDGLLAVANAVLARLDLEAETVTGPFMLRAMRPNLRRAIAACSSMTEAEEIDETKGRC